MTINVIEQTWKEVREEASLVNPTLARIIDNLDPGNQFALFKVRYPYGSEILQEGKFYLPNKSGKLVLLTDSSIPSSLQKKLGYNLSTNSVALVMKKSVELFIPLEDRIVPYSLIKPGKVFGLWPVLMYPKPSLFFVPVPLWGMTAGARSTFLLPKITDAAAYAKIRKKYHTENDPPKSLLDHWQLFKDITLHETFEEKWETELLFFSGEWFENLNDPAWLPLKSYLSDVAWSGSEFWRNQFSWDLTLSRIQLQRRIKPCPYVADITSHLFCLSVGAVPGFSPAIDDTSIPLKPLQRLFENVYCTRYAPIFIEPVHFSAFTNDRPVYYSFNYHTSIKLSQKSSARSSTVNDMYNVQSLLNKYMDVILHGDLKISGTMIYELAKEIKFTFLHHNVNNMEYKNIYSSDMVFKEDTYFTKSLEGCQVTEMPKNPPFLNGCIKILNSKK